MHSLHWYNTQFCALKERSELPDRSQIVSVQFYQSTQQFLMIYLNLQGTDPEDD
jgi:hypothetical protein